MTLIITRVHQHKLELFIAPVQKVTFKTIGLDSQLALKQGKKVWLQMYKSCSNQERRYGGFQNVSQNICIENFILNSLQYSCLVLLTHGICGTKEVHYMLPFLLQNRKHCVIPKAKTEASIVLCKCFK